MTANRFITALLLAELVLAGAFFSTAASRAIDLNELGLSRPESLDVNSIREDSGLDSDRYGQCDESYFDLNGLISDLENSAKSILSQMFQNGIKSLATCIFENMASKVCWLGNCSGGAGQWQCVRVGASDAKAELRAQFERRLQANNMVNCTTATGNDAINETVTAMLQTQGPDGGPAYVQDYNEWLNIRPEKMAQRRMWTLLANYAAQATTEPCKALAAQVLDVAHVPQSYREEPPPVGSDGLAVDGGTPPLLQWQCTIPDGVVFDAPTDAEYEAAGGIDGLMQATSGANNPTELIAMIQAEYQKQVAAMSANANAMANGGSGGFLPIQSDCVPDPIHNEWCIRYGANKQVPGSMRDIVDSVRDALQDEWNSATGEDGANSDIASRIRIQLLDLANAPLPLELEAGQELQRENYRPPATPTPDPTQPSPTPDPSDPACSGQNPACECPPPISPDTLDGFSSVIIKKAAQEARQIHPEFFIGPTNEISAGKERLVLQAVCDQTNIACHPHPLLDDRIVLDLAQNIQVSFIIIINDMNGTFLRIDGGSASAWCTDGSM